MWKDKEGFFPGSGLVPAGKILLRLHATTFLPRCPPKHVGVNWCPPGLHQPRAANGVTGSPPSCPRHPPGRSESAAGRTGELRGPAALPCKGKGSMGQRGENGRSEVRTGASRRIAALDAAPPNPGLGRTAAAPTWLPMRRPGGQSGSVKPLSGGTRPERIRHRGAGAVCVRPFCFFVFASRRTKKRPTAKRRPWTLGQ